MSRTQLDQVNEMIRVTEHLKEMQEQDLIVKAHYEGYQEGFAAAERIYKKIQCDNCLEFKNAFELVDRSNTYGTFYECRIPCKVAKTTSVLDEAEMAGSCMEDVV